MASRDFPRASSVWPEMPFMRGPVAAQRLHELLPELRDIRHRAQQRRERVLAHDWARKRLCLILNLTDANKWNGFIPPAQNAEGAYPINPIRRALIELLGEVRAAEDTVSGATVE